MKKTEIKKAIAALYAEHIHHKGLPAVYKIGMRNYNAALLKLIDSIANENKIEFGVEDAFDGGYRAWFKIGVQTFGLSSVETKTSAKWYVGCLKKALSNLQNPDPFIISANILMAQLWNEKSFQSTHSKRLRFRINFNQVKRIQNTDRFEFVKRYMQLAHGNKWKRSEVPTAFESYLHKTFTFNKSKKAGTSETLKQRLRKRVMKAPKNA